jgi:hypothetical protein
MTAPAIVPPEALEFPPRGEASAEAEGLADGVKYGEDLDRSDGFGLAAVPVEGKVVAEDRKDAADADEAIPWDTINDADARPPFPSSCLLPHWLLRAR